MAMEQQQQQQQLRLIRFAQLLAFVSLLLLFAIAASDCCFASDCCSASASAAAASASASASAGGDEVFIVTMDGTPGVHRFQDMKATASGDVAATSVEAEAYFAELEAEHDAFLSSFFDAMEGGGGGARSYRKLYSYSHVLNGFAVQISAEKAEMLRRAPQVRKMERDWRLQTMTTHTPDFLGLPSHVWPAEGGPGEAGEGIIIGIIDTGIDPSHPSFSSVSSIAPSSYPPLHGFRGRCELSIAFSSCNGKIIAAQHFARAAQAAGVFNASNDFASPLDGDGHGSHTASIAAGGHGVEVNFNGFNFGDASGMAPRARISVYKALYRQFGGFVSDVVAAIDQAAKDGVHVLSLSVGPSSPPSSVRLTFLNAFDVALLAAVKAGVLVVQAAGNGGPYPRTMASFSPWIVSVAAGLDDRSYTNRVFLGNGAELSGIGITPGTRGEQLYDLVLADEAAAKAGNPRLAPACQQAGAFEKSLVEGKILMCTYSFSFVYGGATVRQVVETARSLGAEGFILFATTELPGSKFNPTPFEIPGIVITDVADAMVLVNYYNASKLSGVVAKARLGNGMLPTLKGTAPQVALFSSRGPGVKDYMLHDADVLKPNILAPGSLIWGAWTPIGTDEPDYQGQRFALMSGTSMATPHVAGVAALIRQAHPGWSPAAVASAMMTTAAADGDGSPLLAQRYAGNGSVLLDAATPFDFGHGALNANAALDPGLVFESGYQDYLDFMCAVLGGADGEELVANATGARCETGATNTKPSDLNVPSITIANMVGPTTVKRTVTDVSGRAEVYSVSAEAPPGISVDVRPAAFTLPAAGSVTLAVSLTARSSPSGEYTFGAILLRGNLGHFARLPVAVKIGS